MDEWLLILGASVRAAAASAWRSGFAPYCGDLFYDADVARFAAGGRVAAYPKGLVAFARSAPPGPWMYTGALENHPEIVDAISRQRPLVGNGADVLRAVRDPVETAWALRQSGLACPAIALTSAGVPCDGSWLRKPLRGSGGAGISVWRGASGPLPPGLSTSKDFYFQQWKDGESCAAVYVADGSRAALLGVSRQLVGTPWTGAAHFQYAGSVGPWRLTPRLCAQFERIGQTLAERFCLKGLFGVDAVLAGQTVWPVEVNPRFPASVEVLERARGIDAVRLHVEACRHGRLPASPPPHAPTCCGKAIVYARRKLTVSPRFAAFAQRAMARLAWPDLADIPRAGTLIRAGRPITTVLAEAPDEPCVLALLSRRVAEVETLLYES